MAALAFEAEHRVDHMFKHTRAGDRAVLGDMADQDHRRPALLGEADQFLRRSTNLTDRAGRALDQVAVHRLDRIDDQQRWRCSRPDGGQNIPHRRRRRQPHRRTAEPEPDRAQTHLIDRLLARHIDDIAARLGQLCRDLQQQGRLADARIAAQQHRRSRHDPAADGPVELGNPGPHTLRQGDHRVEPDQIDRLAASLKIVLRGEHGNRRRFLHQRIPLGAVGALPLPSMLLRSARLTDISRLKLRHRGAKLPERSRNASDNLVTRPRKR